MATISLDGQSFAIDGRRIWIVSGAIHYPRVARGLWRSRIRAAKQAGLNTIETYVFWNLHEPAPGKFDFTGNNDLAAFVKMVGEEGMYCIVRPGPYICAEWDFGGFPAWLHRVKDIKLRQHNGPFLEACSRYLTAVMEQIKDQQVTLRTNANPKAGGPIIMIQAENEWLCHNPEEAEKYLRDSVRYLREAGCEVPINMCNNLWATADGTVSTWNANDHLATDLRQLRMVQPDAPRMVTEFWPGWFDRWGYEHHRAFDARWNLYRLAQILATGAQFNLYMFHGGTNFGFMGGRTVAQPDCFMTTSYDYDAPLREAGGRGSKYHAVKRVSMFASNFANLFANLKSDFQHASITPNDNPDHPMAVIEQTGTHGTVIFLLKSQNDKTNTVNVMLANGLSLPVHTGEDRAAWFVLDVNLAGAGTLTYTNLRPYALIDRKILVLFGPAGSEGMMNLNGTPFTINVPDAGSKKPAVEVHEGLAVVVLNHEQVDAAYTSGNTLVVGVAGLDENDKPIPHEDWASVITIRADGTTSASRTKPAVSPRSPVAGKWQQADVDAMLDGSSPSFKAIDGPRSHESIGNDYGYGWYRLTLKNKTQAKHAMAPQSGDRLHFFADGKPAGLLGLAAGAEYDPAKLALGKTNVVLSDNLGRYNFGWHVGEAKGLLSHVYETKPIALGKPLITAGIAPDAFELGQFFHCLRKGARPPADALSWRVKGSGKRALVIDIQCGTFTAMIRCNGKNVGLYHPTFTGGQARFLLEPGKFVEAGVNTIELALFGKFDPKTDLKSTVQLYECTANLTEHAQWAFSPWTAPATDSFAPLAAKLAPLPRWYRTTFNVSSTALPLFVEPGGLSKGQLFLNGVNVGRYFVATAEGKAVPPQSRYYLPEPWLKIGEPNELVIFDEHGKSPAKVKFSYDAMGPYGE